jgi:hypothetical protein
VVKAKRKAAARVAGGLHEADIKTLLKSDGHHFRSFFRAEGGGAGGGGRCICPVFIDLSGTTPVQNLSVNPFKNLSGIITCSWRRGRRGSSRRCRRRRPRRWRRRRRRGRWRRRRSTCRHKDHQKLYMNTQAISFNLAYNIQVIRRRGRRRRRRRNCRRKDYHHHHHQHPYQSHRIPLLRTLNAAARVTTHRHGVPSSKSRSTVLSSSETFLCVQTV